LKARGAPRSTGSINEKISSYKEKRKQGNHGVTNHQKINKRCSTIQSIEK